MAGEHTLAPPPVRTNFRRQLEVIALGKLRKANGQFKKGHGKVRKSKKRR